MSNMKLDPEEKTLLKSVEHGELKSTRNRKAEISRLGAAARATLRKNRRIVASETDERGLK